MGKGYDYTRKVALEAARELLQKLVANNTINRGNCQIGQLSQDLTTVTFADGTSQTVVVQGQPNDYIIVCNGLAINPEAVQVSLTSSGGKGLVASIDSNQNFYLRNTGSPAKCIVPKLTPTGFQLDSRITPANSQIRIAADGKAVLIGGFFQDVPVTFVPSGSASVPWSPPTDGSNDGAYQIPVPGYTYHTVAQYIVYTGVSLTTDVSGNGVFNWNQGFFGQLDLTEECIDKISAPTQEGVGSASIYRLYPSQADLYLCQQNTVDGSCGFAHARFFPAVFQQFTATGDPYDQDESPFLPRHYTKVATSGQYQNGWTSDGHTYPLFFGKGQPWGCTPANMLFAFNVDTNGVYTMDIVADISYAAIYKIDFDRITTNNAWAWNQLQGAPPTRTAFANCYSNQLQAQQYSYNYNALYPYIQPFHNLHSDKYLVNATTSIVGQFPQIVHSQGGTSTGGGATPTGFIITNGSLTATQTNFGNLCNGSPCLYFYLTLGADGAGLCVGPGETEGCEFCNYVSTNNYQITDYDGTFFSINDFGPVFSAGFSGFFIFPRDGGCNPPSCPGTNGFMSVVDSFFFQLTGGFIDGYRFGRGTAAFNQVLTIKPTPGTSNPVQYDLDNQYKGPTIAVSRLISPLNQNHLYQVFRSTANNTALVYQIADPYVPPTGSGPTQPQYQALLDELNNDQAFNGVNVLNDDIIPPDAGGNNGQGGFSMYIWSSPYISSTGGLVVNSSNYVLPPDVFTDKILSPHGTFPFGTTQILKGVDSYIVQGYFYLTDQITNTVTEVIQQYNIDSTGLTTKAQSVSRILPISGETLYDFLLPITVQ